MSGWSLPVGKVFGVELRLHLWTVLLLFLCSAWATALGRPVARGFVLWVLLLLALAVREIARALVTACFRLPLSSLQVIPVGALVGYGTSEASLRSVQPRVGRWLALAGPAANILFALTVAGLVLAAAPGVDLVDRPWISPLHLLRALVWLNLLLAALHFLPAWPFDGGWTIQSSTPPASTTGKSPYRSQMPHDAVGRGLAAFGPVVAVVLIVSGVLTVNYLLFLAGCMVLIFAQVDRHSSLLESSGGAVHVRDVMLTEYSILPASATLEDALEQARHTLQDVFPVVRSGNLVGAVARGHIVAALDAGGNGYVQGIMARTFQTATPGDPLLPTLDRVSAQAGMSSQLVPVLEGDQVVGILTPSSLQRSMGLLGRAIQRVAVRSPERNSEDEPK